MPLIRYEVGDLGSIDNFSSNCSCGRSLPILNNIEGRLDDMIITPDGRHIGRLDPVFKSEMKIKEAQIIQEALDLVHVKVVPTEGFNQLDEIDIKKRIEQRLGASINVVVETVAEIPRTKAGKFKAVISNLKK
jgi:phenylacetate-CoA ligase